MTISNDVPSVTKPKHISLPPVVKLPATNSLNKETQVEENLIKKPATVNNDSNPKNYKKTVKTIALFAAFTIIPFLLSVTFVYTANVPSVSMEPTIPVGSKIVGLKNLPMNVDRGDIVSFNLNNLEDWGSDNQIFVKRVIGVAGDEILYIPGEKYILLNGEPLIEPYLADLYEVSNKAINVVVPENTLFVMGDNRNQSHDSRSHNSHFIPSENIISVVLVTLMNKNTGGAVG
jgi:signal peptidase I